MTGGAKVAVGRSWLIVIAVVVLAAILVGTIESNRKSDAITKKARAYCQTAEVGHDTELTTLMELGDPDTRVVHQGTLYLAYGKVTFFYDWTGYEDSSDLAGKIGC